MRETIISLPYFIIFYNDAINLNYMHHVSIYYYKSNDPNYTNFGIDLYITESTMYRLTLNTTGVLNKMQFHYGVETSKDNWKITTIWTIS